jgi:hypothetical protein
MAILHTAWPYVALSSPPVNRKFRRPAGAHLGRSFDCSEDAPPGQAGPDQDSADDGATDESRHAQRLQSPQDARQHAGLEPWQVLDEEGYRKRPRYPLVRPT